MGDFYVSTTGDDSRNCLTAHNAATPKLTVYSGIQCLQTPGDRLIIRGGVYVSDPILLWASVMASGNAGNPMRIEPYPGEVVTLRMGSSSTGTLIDTFDVSYVTIKNLLLDGNGVSDQCLKIDSTDPAADGFFIVENVDMFNSALDGVLVGMNNNIFRNVTTRDHGAYGLYCTNGYNLFEQMDIHHNGRYGVHFYTAGDQLLYNILQQSKVHHNGQLFSSAGIITGGLELHLFNTLVYANIGDGVQINQAGPTRILTYNCTLFGNTGYGYAAYQGTTHRLKNTIVYGNTLGPIHDDTSAEFAGNVTASDPMFVDSANGDFRTLVGSPARGTGVDLSADLTLDYLGNTRNLPYDAGAYQANAVTPASLRCFMMRKNG